MSDNGRTRKPKTITQRCQFNQRKFLAAFVEVGTIAGGMQTIKMERKRFYAWLDSDSIDKDGKTFKERYEAAKEDAVDALEGEARKRAMANSDRLLMFLLNGRRSDIFKYHAPQIAVPAQPKGPIDLSKCSDEELTEIRRAITIIRSRTRPREVGDSGDGRADTA